MFSSSGGAQRRPLDAVVRRPAQATQKAQVNKQGMAIIQSAFTILPAVSNDQHKIGNFNTSISSLSSNRNLKGQGSVRCELQIKILLGKVKTTEVSGFDQGWCACGEIVIEVYRVATLFPTAGKEP